MRQPREKRAAGPHPDAPPETEQFAFLIGEWDCTVRSMGPGGTLGPPAKAKWVGRWDLAGWAIRDDWTGRIEATMAAGRGSRE